MTYLEIITYIVGEKNAGDWITLMPKVYVKHAVPYGLIATKADSEGVIFIASTTSQPEKPFTKNMIRDIIALYETKSVCLVTSHKPSQRKIASFLKRYGFKFTYVGGVMLSTHIKE